MQPIAPLFKPKNFVITYLGNGTTPFTPEFKTSVSTTIRWKPDDAPETVTGPGTIHNFSYVPSSGWHRCTVRATGGYGLVNFVGFQDDNVLYAPVGRLPLVATLSFRNEPNLEYNIRRVPRYVTFLVIDNVPGISGSLSDVPRGVYTLYLFSNQRISGTLTDVFFVSSQLSIMYLPLVVGSISDLNPNLTILRLYGNPQFTIGDISKYTKIQDLQLQNMLWSQAQVDTVIDYIYAAVVADPNHFTYSNPKLNIGGNNAAPSGTYQYSATPSTGLEKVYYLCNLADHHWTITYTGGTKP